MRLKRSALGSSLDVLDVQLLLNPTAFVRLLDVMPHRIEPAARLAPSAPGSLCQATSRRCTETDLVSVTTGEVTE